MVSWPACGAFDDDDGLHRCIHQAGRPPLQGIASPLAAVSDAELSPVVWWAPFALAHHNAVAIVTKEPVICELAKYNICCQIETVEKLRPAAWKHSQQPSAAARTATAACRAAARGPRPQKYFLVREQVRPVRRGVQAHCNRAEQLRRLCNMTGTCTEGLLAWLPSTLRVVCLLVWMYHKSGNNAVELHSSTVPQP
ncbi:hypothetical protein HaLaN_01172 [Haematococcus lacustris]|uniref:Uncharacterized protein n=1 Tax=Haematococcus lacustris TaxID=44745 RepID=A0A699Y8N6_HAELA|nr:hypothetical protein HaLaN_01172 [Haematococcus lacustris]